MECTTVFIDYLSAHMSWPRAEVYRDVTTAEARLVERGFVEAREYECPPFVKGWIGDARSLTAGLYVHSLWRRSEMFAVLWSESRLEP